MASSSSSSSSGTPQAGPLPSKRGEIGFDEEIHGVNAGTTTTGEVEMPERHPEDRREAAAAATTTPAPSATAPSASASTTTLSSSSSATAVGSSPPHSRSPSLLKRPHFPSLKSRKFLGISLSTLIAFTIQFLLFAGTIVGWALAILIVMRTAKRNDAPGGSSAIFIHVVFSVALMGQLLFLERRIFRMRAERYAFKHPGQILPSHLTRGNDDAAVDDYIAFSPWNRPPLPTYAAALAASGQGVGTGDVEDVQIMIVQASGGPPPAYGNTRGSVMLLSGFLRESLRAQRPASTVTQEEGGWVTIDVERADRPLSYQSQDEQWQEIQDAERARRLEETLARLERSPSRNP